MRILYLVNTYPLVSLTFIRREIQAIEALGIEIIRVSVRPPAADLIDPADLEEAAKTRVLLQGGALGLLPDLIKTMLRHPLRFAGALGQALRLSWQSDTGAVRHMAYLAEACMLARVARELQATHIHAHFATNPPTVALLAERLGGPGFSFTMHNLEDDAQGRRLKLGRKVAASRFAVAISSYGRSQLFSLAAPETHARIHVVHCGLDSAFLQKAPSAPPDRPDLLFIGRLCPEKQPLLLIEAVAKLAAEGIPFRLRIAGTGELEMEVRERIHRRGVADRCEMLGALDGDQILRELDACRVLVLPSRSEGLPLVLMEAMARQRPVVTTFVAGIPELVRDGKDGWLVPVGDVPSLVAALKAALSASPEELQRMGRSGAERVLERHNIEDSARALVGLFRRYIPSSATA